MVLTPVSNVRFIGAFDLSLASFVQSFDVSSEESTPQDVAFSNVGGSMFVIGNASEKVHQYSLTGTLDLSSASFTGTSFDVSGEAARPRGFTFNNDGTTMFVVGTQSEKVHQYSLSTGFDLSSASFSGTSFDVSGQDTAPQGVTFNNDGTTMFVMGFNSQKAHQYSLTTAFDVGSASFTGTSFDVSGQDTAPRNITFGTDGTTMFVVGSGSDKVFQYSLATGFDLSSASFNGTSFDVSGQDTTTHGLTFSDEGTSMFTTGINSDSVFRYLVGEAVPT